MSPAQFVIQSAIPATTEPINVTDNLPPKTRREMENVRDWLELQEEYEMRFLIEEMACAEQRNNRRNFYA